LHCLLYTRSTLTGGGEPVGQKRILIVSQYSLFDQGLRAALSQQPDVEVIGVYRDLEAAYVQARSLRPDVMLLIAGPDIARDSAFRLLEEVSSSIIRISPTDGSMQVYRREQVDQATLEDLMTAIQTTAIQWKTRRPEDLASRQMVSKPGGYPTRRRRDSMKHFIAVAILVAIVTALVTIGLESTHLLPPLASEQGALVDGLLGLHIRVIAFLFSLILVITLYSIVVFRRRPGDTEDGLHIEGNAALEIVWTIIPLGTVLFFATLGARQLSQITTPAPDEMVIEVTAQQFAWRFDYPDYGITSAELNLPRGRQILFKLTSMDVIHSFWVPEFRIKQDAVPGMTTTLRITPSQVGQYKVRCAELCGTGHYAMLATANVMEPADFEAWVEKETAASKLAGAELGAKLATTQGCIGCHSIDGSQLVGPTWLGLYGEKVTTEDGTSIQADEEYLRQSILDPASQIVKGFPNVMPNTYKDTLSQDDVNALIEYIKSLGK
jgi:cytochrome c oxidase subunit 2